MSMFGLRYKVTTHIVYLLILVDYSLPSLIEAIRQQNDGGLLPGSASGPTSMMQSGINQAKELDDPQGLHEKTEYLLREWVQMYHNPNMGRDTTKAFSTFVTQVHNQIHAGVPSSLVFKLGEFFPEI